MLLVWERLKVIKSKLKGIHNKEFKGIQERIDLSRQQLDLIQTQLQSHPTDSSLLVQGQECPNSLRKWLKVKEIASKQKSRLHWLKSGDANNKFFFAAVKERHKINGIDLLMDDSNVKLEKPEEIQKEVINFYSSLLGSCATQLPAIDITTMRSDSRLSYQDRISLCLPVTNAEINLALKGIDDSKAPEAAAKTSKLLQKVVGKVVSECQAGFITGRHIADNILLATELVKGYNRKHLSPSVLINGKTCPPLGDPLSPFLFALGMEYLSRNMQQLKKDPNFNFPPKCEKLNITHMMFAHDLLMFCRADLTSASMLFQKFLLFSQASGLEENLQRQILDELRIPTGDFPFRYLGVPLSTKKLAYIQCKPLIDRVLARAKSWTTRYLSYAGRLQLVKTILLSLQSFWCQIFVLPKKVIREIQRYCRVYMWISDTTTSKKALVSWANICLPRSAGGWNIKDMETWNKAAVCKLLWDLTHKKDKMWVRWVDTYYIKGRSITGTHWC
ncbi:uncharacterized protein [Spinacia oleracea]|uniref:Reverse transcriptase domain-containing protein n=1 Tax=Spinacia oleracea TaxID=3562 RepID=A0ABM3RQ20_SPIOL|nr:uncharacterized protein LOC130471511 [Spinacia oleracea]